jgi:hypothetical protein
MVLQLVKIETKVEPITAHDGGKGWREEFPDANKYNLKWRREFGDYRHTTPLAGYNTEVWLIDGIQGDIDKFVSDNAGVVTKLTPTDAKTLADTIRPRRTVVCSGCGGTGEVAIPAWTSPV